jgi:deferrochelatase/peroxidase EfeB
LRINPSMAQAPLACQKIIIIIQALFMGIAICRQHGVRNQQAGKIRMTAKMEKGSHAVHWSRQISGICFLDKPGQKRGRSKWLNT